MTYSSIYSPINLQIYRILLQRTIAGAYRLTLFLIEIALDGNVFPMCTFFWYGLDYKKAHKFKFNAKKIWTCTDLWEAQCDSYTLYILHIYIDYIGSTYIYIYLQPTGKCNIMFCLRIHASIQFIYVYDLIYIIKSF